MCPTPVPNSGPASWSVFSHAAAAGATAGHGRANPRKMARTLWASPWCQALRWTCLIHLFPGNCKKRLTKLFHYPSRRWGGCPQIHLFIQLFNQHWKSVHYGLGTAVLSSKNAAMKRRVLMPRGPLSQREVAGRGARTPPEHRHRETRPPALLYCSFCPWYSPPRLPLGSL